MTIGDLKRRLQAFQEAHPHVDVDQFEVSVLGRRQPPFSDWESIAIEEIEFSVGSSDVMVFLDSTVFFGPDPLTVDEREEWLETEQENGTDKESTP